MTKVKIGDLYSLKNHPYEIGASDVKISAFANMTPPILVVSEIMNSSKEYDGETGEEKSKQVKCIFYSHKSHRFESFWFNIKQIKPIFQVIKENLNEEVVNTDFVNIKDEVATSHEDNLKEVGIGYQKSVSITELKNIFLNEQVILKSCDQELGKIKTTLSKIDNKLSQKANSHLDFLPPVLTVIDVKVNDEKIAFHPKSGNQKKITSYFLLKCKWYNPSTSHFSEDFIPIETLRLVPKTDSLGLISALIFKKALIKQSFKEHIVLDSGVVLNHSYIQPIELIFNHYKYKLKYFDIFKTKYSEIDLSDIDVDSECIELKDIIINKIPEYDVIEQEFSTVKGHVYEKETYYRITYKDLMDKITRRVIYVKEFVKDKVIIADCLLRDGDERHFRLEEGGVLKIEELEAKFFV